MHLGQMFGGAGFARIVAIKRLHPHLAETPEAVRMLLDEARLSARVRHPNIVATLDVVADDGEILLVFEYIHGASLAYVAESAAREKWRFPLPVVAAVMSDVLAGLQAVHEATDELGLPLDIVHRDVSPQNVMVGADGVARVLDFGIAKAHARLQTTKNGQIKGKLRYLAPEQLRNESTGPGTDVYAASIILWELLTGEALFDGVNEGAILAKVLQGVVIPPSRFSSDIPRELDGIVARGMARDPAERFASCREMAAAIRAVLTPATADQVAVWIGNAAKELLDERAARIARIESGAPDAPPEEPRFDVTLTDEQVVDPAPFAQTELDHEPVVPPQEGPPRPRWLTVLVALSVFTGVTAVGLQRCVFPKASRAAAERREVSASAGGASAPNAASAPGESASVAPPPVFTAPLASPAKSSIASDEPPSPRTSPTSGGGGASKARVASHPPPRPKPKPRVESAPSCSPPYTVEKGIRYPKPECL